MNRTGYIHLKLIWGMAATNCKGPYHPPNVSALNSYLVIEDVINAGPDSTFIKLSGTVKILYKAVGNPEIGAPFTVEYTNKRSTFLAIKNE